jgi:phage terminase large subunit-like protein
VPLVQTTRLPDGAKFSRRKADRAIWFVEHACVHTKSSYKGKPFILGDWQKGSATKVNGQWEFTGIMTPLFGAQQYSAMHKTWVRRYTMAWLEMARKNGKSELMAALGLYLLIFDGEWGAEIYGAASDKDQAAQVFDVARDMIYLSPMLGRMREKGELEIVDSRKRIVYNPTRSFYRVVAADAAGNLGANPHAILFDEVLAQPNNELWNYLRQGFGIRPQPLLLAATTAGPNRESFAFGEHEFSLKVGANPNEDPKRFVFMAYTDEKSDWKDESQWPEANPGLGDFLNIDMIRDEMVEAINKGDLSAVAHFKIFRLNQWGTSQNLWLDIGVWDDSETVTGGFTDEEAKLGKAIAGFDLAETMDFTAWVVVHYSEDKVMVRPRFWITKKALEMRHKKRADTLMKWIDEGYITVFNSEVHDYDKIRDAMLNDIGEYGIKMFGYDPWQAPGIVSYLEDKSPAMAVKVPQLTTRMDPGAKELTRLLGQRRFTANGNPVLRWNANNAGYKSDSEGHIKPHKANSTGNIDGITALVNALSVKVTVPEQDGNIFVFDDDDETPEQLAERDRRERQKRADEWKQTGRIADEDDDDF